MKLFKGKSIRTKLKLVIILTCVLTIILVCAALFIYEHLNYREILVNDLKTKAQIISENINASITFRDSTDAARILNSLKSQPHVIAAAVYDSDMNVFADYFRGNKHINIPLRPAFKGWQYEDNALVLYNPIILDDTIGTIYLRADLETEKKHFKSLLIIALLVLAGASAVGYFVAVVLEKNISVPIMNLTDTIKKVSGGKDYSLRAIKMTNDETGYLADSFNQFLVQIQGHNTDLKLTNKRMLEEINERKYAQEILKESEERFRNLFESHPLPMWVFDMETLRFLEVNESALNKYGYTRDEFLSLTIIDIRPAEDVPKLMQNLNKLREPLEHSGPWRHLLKNRTLIDVEIFSHITIYNGRKAVVVVANEITERLKAEQDLKNSEERYRSTLDNLMEGCQIIGFDYKYLYLNDVAAKQGHKPKEELIGLTMTEAFPGIEKSPFFSDLKKCMDERIAVHMKNEFIYPDNTTGWFNLDIEPVPEGAFILSTDITKEKMLNDELENYHLHLEELVNERTSQLAAANKELEAFSYSVSHDLRAPLRHIDGFAELLKKNAMDKLDARGSHFLEIISDSAKQMGILIDELLVFSRMGRMEMRKTISNINLIVQDVISGFSHDTDGRNINWKIENLPEADVDPSMIKLVFQNLIGNAVKYSRTREAAQITIGSEVKEKEIIFYVCDNGVGFDMKYKDKLFGVFQRLHSAEEFEGTGIGLANVYRIITRHGGTVWAEGELNKGASFYFSIPVKPL